MYLVDTNVVSEARRGTRQAVQWFRSVDPDEVHLSVVTLGEIMRGIANKQKTDSAVASDLAGWLQALRNDHRDRILSVTDQIAIEWGRLAAVRVRAGLADGLIAATANVHTLVVVTRNAADFLGLADAVINPWDIPRPRPTP